MESKKRDGNYVQSCHSITGERRLNPVRTELRLENPHGILKKMSVRDGCGLREELLQMGTWLRLVQFGLEMQAATAVAEAADMVKLIQKPKGSQNSKLWTPQNQIRTAASLVYCDHTPITHGPELCLSLKYVKAQIRNFVNLLYLSIKSFFF